MIKSGQRGSENMGYRVNADHIVAVPYRNRSFPTLGIEPMRLSDLQQRMAPDHFATFQRPEFHLLLLFTTGTAHHYLDFERIDCQPGTLLHVRPGQVQQFTIEPRVEAHIVLFTPEFVSPERMETDTTDGFENLVDKVLPDGILHCDPACDRGIADAVVALAKEYAQTDGSALSARILQHLLQTLLLRVVRVSSAVQLHAVYDGYSRTFRRFCKLVDANFARTRTVRDYARMLGCGTKTLNRACLASRNIPPKELIGRRVVLEAKRLLAHTPYPVDRIAEAVGFSETTNFIKFFRCRELVGPTDFRARFPGQLNTPPPSVQGVCPRLQSLRHRPRNPSRRFVGTD